jgi:hypothetical protein
MLLCKVLLSSAFENIIVLRYLSDYIRGLLGVPISLVGDIAITKITEDSRSSPN